MIVRGIVQTVCFALLLFVPAGTPAWPQGWAFFVLFCVCNVGIGVWLMKTNPLWAQALGAVLILVAYGGWVPVLAANRYAATTIEIQPGQTVASTGPYAVVRHPMYAYALLFMIGVPLMLGSLWGLVALVALLPLLVARTLGEEALLLDGLPGYRAYAANVRYRLVPGVW